jgi:hypothetical protein
MAWKDHIPRLHKYAIDFYDGMYSLSTLTDPRELPEFGLTGTVKLRIFHGKMMEVARITGLSSAQTYEAAGLLYRINSLTRLAASNPHKDGYWILNFKPTREQLHEFTENSKQMTRRIAPSRMDVILTDIAGLRERVAELEKLLNDHLRGGKTLS